MTEFERELGKVEKVTFGFEDHGLLTLNVALSFSGSGQSFGGLCLWSPHRREGVSREQLGIEGAATCDYLCSVLALFGVDDFEAVEGRYCYALRRDGRLGRIEGLQLPEVDGGGRFVIDEWRAKWWPEKYRKGEGR